MLVLINILASCITMIVCIIILGMHTYLPVHLFVFLPILYEQNHVEMTLNATQLKRFFRNDLTRHAI